MYFTLKYIHLPAGSEPRPVVTHVGGMLNYFIGKNTPEEFNLVVEADSSVEVKEQFVNFDCSSTITKEMWENLLALYQAEALPTPDYAGVVKEVFFYVPGDDPRPLSVDSGTPQYRILDCDYECLSKVCVPYSHLEQIIAYWPDSFGHRAIIHDVKT